MCPALAPADRLAEAVVAGYEAELRRCTLEPNPDPCITLTRARWRPVAEAHEGYRVERTKP